MSGQYPPPNPGHPFTRAPTLTPWGQPAGMNMVGNSMNFYGSPHMGLPGRGGQPWVPQQTHPKPADSRPAGNPLYGLQMLMAAESGQRIPTEYQQEETMDLSSHSSAPTEPKLGSARSENTDSLRNGTILPIEVNGEVNSDRTETPMETEVKESVVTSVIAANPLRECVIDALNCSKTTDNFVPRRVEQSPPQVVSEESIKSTVSSVSPQSLDTCKSVITPGSVSSTFVSSVLKTTGSIELLTSDSTSPSNNDSVGEKAKEDDVLQNSDDLSKHIAFHNVSPAVEESDMNVSKSSCLEISVLSVDTDESRLVVAESPVEDIFGISPKPQPERSLQPDKLFSSDPTGVPSLQESIPSDSVVARAPQEFGRSEEVIGAVSAAESISERFSEVISISSKSEPSTTKPVTAAAPSPIRDPEPTPSVENVEILLENMFNSQEETSCSSQNSGGVPQSVIVSNGSRALADNLRPVMDMITPMKEDELAKTLAEDDCTMEDAEIKEEKKEDPVTDDFMDEIEKKLEMLTESNSCESQKFNAQAKVELPEIVEEPCCSMDVKKENVEDILSSTEPLEPKLEEKPSEPVLNLEPFASKPEPGPSTSNPFIEVETQLEKMFAGIVEPADEAVSDNQSQPSLSEVKKPAVSKRSVSKRKKANSRRPSDNSLFGGSSGESTPVKKKGRKRVNDSGNEKFSNRKMKVESAEGGKKRIVKDSSNDSLSRVRGPFVHIEGSKESPANVVVVNSGVRPDDDDGTDKANARRRHSSMQRTEGGSRKVGLAYNSSTLSMRYNSDTADLSWVCVFCKRGPHCAGTESTGDLFGPYRIPATPSTEELVPPGMPSDRDLVEEQKRRGGGKYPKSLRASGGSEHFVQKMAKKSKRSQSTDSWEDQAGLLSVEGGYEVWLHGDCAEWAPGLCIIGAQLVGLDDAVWTALRTRCCQCGEPGASIGCVVRSCPAIAHYHCATATDWLLDTETFIARCHSHRTRLRPT